MGFHVEIDDSLEGPGGIILDRQFPEKLKHTLVGSSSISHSNTSSSHGREPCWESKHLCSSESDITNMTNNIVFYCTRSFSFKGITVEKIIVMESTLASSFSISNVVICSKNSDCRFTTCKDIASFSVVFSFKLKYTWEICYSGSISECLRFCEFCCCCRSSTCIICCVFPMNN